MAVYYPSPHRNRTTWGKKVLRRCLGYCGGMFWSEGPYNRVCRQCQDKQAEVSPMATKVFSRRYESED